MQERIFKRDDIARLFDLALRMARRYGQIGHFEPDDICQDVMLKVLDRPGRELPGAGWLYRVVRNTAADAGRIAARHARLVILYAEDQQVSSVCESTGERHYVSPAGKNGRDFEDNADLTLRLESMLSKLSDRRRQALVLYADGHSYEEIATLSGVSVGTVKSRLYYGRRRARQLLNRRR